MKKGKEHIDQLFKQKLEQQTFELKDSYLADFESKLNAYNRKKKVLFWWYIAPIAILLGAVTLHVFLPEKQKTNVEHQTVRSKIEKNTSKNAKKVKSKKSLNRNDVETQTIQTLKHEGLKKETKYSANSIEMTEQTPSKTDNTPFVRIDANLDNKKTITTISNRVTDDVNNGVDKDVISNVIEEDKSKIDSIQENQVLNQNNLQLKNEEPRQEDIIIDDTIKRQVIIVDTIIQRDTVVITDTVRRKIKLFKKKV